MISTTVRVLRKALRTAEAMAIPEVIRKVQESRLTYLDQGALCGLADQVAAIEREGVDGSIVETGCALGGSSIVIATGKSRHRRLEVYDVFGQIPAPSNRDGADVHARYDVIASGKSAGIGGDGYYGYEQDLLAKVRANFSAFGVNADDNNVQFIRGLYEDTLRPQAPIALAHIDCDWYDSVMVCLERIVPGLAPRGRIVVDDYFAYSGCRAAVWDYFRPRLEQYRFHYGSRLLITHANG